MLARFAILILTLVLTSPDFVFAQQALKLPSCFGDHMVLQQQKPIKIWGWAEAGELVNVNFHGVSINTKAAEDGRWQAILPEFQADSSATSMTIQSGEEEVSIEDVLIGEVWFASGQSNMAWTLNRDRRLGAGSCLRRSPRFSNVPGGANARHRTTG